MGSNLIFGLNQNRNNKEKASFGRMVEQERRFLFLI